MTNIGRGMLQLGNTQIYRTGSTVNWMADRQIEPHEAPGYDEHSVPHLITLSVAQESLRHAIALDGTRLDPHAGIRPVEARQVPL